MQTQKKPHRYLHGDSADWLNCNGSPVCNCDCDSPMNYNLNGPMNPVRPPSGSYSIVGGPMYYNADGDDDSVPPQMQGGGTANKIMEGVNTANQAAAKIGTIITGSEGGEDPNEVYFSVMDSVAGILGAIPTPWTMAAGAIVTLSATLARAFSPDFPKVPFGLTPGQAAVLKDIYGNAKDKGKMAKCNTGGHSPACLGMNLYGDGNCENCDALINRIGINKFLDICGAVTFSKMIEADPYFHYIKDVLDVRWLLVTAYAKNPQAVIDSLEGKPSDAAGDINVIWDVYKNNPKIRVMYPQGFKMVTKYRPLPADAPQLEEDVLPGAQSPNSPPPANSTAPKLPKLTPKPKTNTPNLIGDVGKGLTIDLEDEKVLGLPKPAWYAIGGGVLLLIIFLIWYFKYRK